MAPDSLTCSACERTVSRSAAVRTGTYGDLDPEKWQSLCCPDCGRKLETVFVADEGGLVGGVRGSEPAPGPTACGVPVAAFRTAL